MYLHSKNLGINFFVFLRKKEKFCVAKMLALLIKNFLLMLTYKSHRGRKLIRMIFYLYLYSPLLLLYHFFLVDMFNYLLLFPLYYLCKYCILFINHFGISNRLVSLYRIIGLLSFSHFCHILPLLYYLFQLLDTTLFSFLIIKYL